MRFAWQNELKSVEETLGVTIQMNVVKNVFELWR